MNYPLLIEFTGTVFGKAFVAEITATGRLLAVQNTQEWWLYGVNPGAIAEVGVSLEEAHCAMRASLREIIIDFAEEAGSFEEFKASVEEFFLTSDAATEAEWLDSVTRVRGSKERLDDLPTRPAVEPFVWVREKPIALVTSKDNTIRVEPALAKAA